MARIRIDDLPLGENLTPEQEELIHGSGRRTFRPTLESLENREMMDAGLGDAMILQMSQEAQVRLLAEQTSALQNLYNPFSQSLTQRSPAPLGQVEQPASNMPPLVDKIFSAWSLNIDPVVQDMESLQHLAPAIPHASLAGLVEGQQVNRVDLQTSAPWSGVDPAE